MKRIGLLITPLLAIMLFMTSIASAKGVSFTQEDRNRLIRLEVKLEEGLKATNQRIDTLQTFMLWGFGILFGGMGILIGFVIWDRRTALAPAIKKSNELQEREDKLEKALRRYAIKNPDLAEILRSLRLM